MSMKRNVLGVDVEKVLRDETLVESSLGNIPDFRLEEAVDLMIARLTSHIKLHITQDRSRDPVEKSDAINRAAKVLKEIEDDVLELVKEKLLMYSRE